MATFTFYQPADMLAPYIWYGSVTSHSSSQITISNGAGSSGTYYGSFTFSSYGLTGGTVTGYDSYNNYVIDYSVRNASIDALTLNNYLNSGNAIGLEQFVLSGNDQIIGSSGNDTLIGWGGNDTIDGGGGFNTAAYTGPTSNYEVTINPSSIIVHDYTGADGTDTLTNIQQLQFTDTTLQTKWFTEAASLAGSNPSQFTFLTELYIAYFNRAPDAVGLDYWASVNYEGHTLSDIAGYISSQPETVALYSPITASSPASAISSFITSVYQNVLDRAPDSSGAQYWLGEIQSGAVTMAQYIGDVIYAATVSGNSDAVYLVNKELAGAHFAITDGLTNGTQAHAVMALFNSTYQSSGAATAVTAANNLSDSYLANVVTNHELVAQLVGVSV
jgi:hypothetical protein